MGAFGCSRKIVRDEVKKKNGAAVALMENDEDEKLFQDLRALRLSLAKAKNVPPYVIFHDSTLAALVKLRPRTLGDMGRVPGVGNDKLERYGDAFVRALAG
jgi:ATP-dependent DNA helicase RecQ